MYNEAAKNASLKYQKENIKKVPLEISLVEYDDLKRLCEEQGERVATYIKLAAEEKMRRMDKEAHDGGC